MEAPDSTTNLGAIQQLEKLFYSADPAKTGLLSYSEFAYLILKSGGSQEQVDALIDQFSVPSRAQRMVCYAALLRQLTESVEEENTASRQHGASFTGPADFVDGFSPPPVPPPPPCGPPTTVPTASFAQTVDRRSSTSPFALGSRNDSLHNGEQRSLSSNGSYRPIGATSPLLCSVTHAGSRAGSTLNAAAASAAGAVPTTSRDSSVASNGALQRHRHQEQRQQDQQQVYFTEAQRGHSGSSPRTPFQLSSRFVASALRAAQEQGMSKSRSQSKDRGSSYHQQRRQAPPVGQSYHQARNGGASRGAVVGSEELLCRQGQSAAHSVESAFLRSHIRDDAVARMTGAAKDARSRQAEKKSGQSLSPSSPVSSSLSIEPQRGLMTHDTPNPPTTPQRAANTSLLSSSHIMPRGSNNSRQSDSVLSSTSATSGATLLSLRDVFQRYLLPAASGGADVAESPISTVQLSTLESVFAKHSIGIHPLELEAVVDSLELPSDNLSNVTPSFKNDDENASLGRSAVDASSALTVGDNTTTVTITGGSDRALGLVDFCVLVSRLRPTVIQRIRSPATWFSGQGAPGNVRRKKISTAADVASRRSAEIKTSASTLDASYETPQAHLHNHAARLKYSHNNKATTTVASDEESNEPSIADVTVSPMTPPTANTTPPSHHHPASSLSYRPYQDACPTRSSTSLVDSRRPVPLQQQQRQRKCQPHHDTRDGAAYLSRSLMMEEEDPPPTARQLSSDREFSVLEDAPTASVRGSPHTDEESAYEEKQRVRYAQSTTSSDQHARLQANAASTTSSLVRQKAVSLRRRKQPVWHTNLNRSRTHDRTGKWSVTDRASPLSTVSDTARSLHSSVSSLRQRPHRSSLPTPCSRFVSSPRRVSVSIGRSPSTPTSTPASQSRKTGLCTRSGLSPRLLEAVQGAATNVLLRCMQLDLRHSGCISRRAWTQVLRSACPSLSETDRQKVEAWIERLCRRHTAVRGDVYAEVVEEILTEKGGAATVAVTPSSGGSPFYLKRKVPSTQSLVTPSSANSTETATATTSKDPATVQQATERIEKWGRASDDAVKQRLRAAFMSACGGDTDALHAYLEAFDEGHHGYIHEHVWRACVAELFRRTMSREAPQWVLDRCTELARLPFDRVAAQEQRGLMIEPASAAEKSARARVSCSPPNKPTSALCDYTYMLQELGLDSSLQ